MVPGACTCYLVRCWMCWRHPRVKKGESLKKYFWISLAVGVLIPCCVSRQCRPCFALSTSCWEHRLRLWEQECCNVEMHHFFCSEALSCKNNDLRALLAVNERHMSSNLTFKTLVAFTRVEISERWHLCETSGDSGTDWRTFHAPPGSVSSVWPFWKESDYFSSSSQRHTHYSYCWCYCKDVAENWLIQWSVSVQAMSSFSW